MTAPIAAARQVTVIQGEFHVSDEPGLVQSTLLGSCVSVCLHDPAAGVGGLNHFLLPDRVGTDTATLKHGTNAMELLINGLLRMGGHRDRLVAKVFGGSRMSDAFQDIGASNIDFARRFLKAESIPCLSEDVGGTLARRIRFVPATGQAQVMRVPRAEAPAERMPPPVAAAPETITLF
ncbi:MAG: chemotaxis signal relay system protein CheD [Rhodobacteraceae bacterium HLUCCA08]|nr:MAG: chemotaxis signal relay system protein CheD [Rhodobacteraceae bacterium HLUCCA08]